MTDKKDLKDDKQAGDHPFVAGKAECKGSPEKSSSLKFAGREYHASGKSGKSIHDDTPVREFEHESGHKVWMDDAARVHANNENEVDGLRQESSKYSSGDKETVKEDTEVAKGGVEDAKKTDSKVDGRRSGKDIPEKMTKAFFFMPADQSESFLNLIG